MKKSILLLVLSIYAAPTMIAQDVLGKWYSTDSETGKNESIIEVYKADDKVYGKIIQLLDEEDEGKRCTECTGKDKDKPIEGLVIIRGLSKDGDEWSDGKILDPKNGKFYKCYISLEEIDKLKLRGYIGFSLLGRTEYWHRVSD